MRGVRNPIFLYAIIPFSYPTSSIIFYHGTKISSLLHLFLFWSYLLFRIFSLSYLPIKVEICQHFFALVLGLFRTSFIYRSSSVLILYLDEHTISVYCLPLIHLSPLVLYFYRILGKSLREWKVTEIVSLLYPLNLISLTVGFR